MAAANPVGGRYDRSRSLKANLNITPAIMSRFDLLFVVLDENSVDVDAKLATHIVKVHQRKDSAVKPMYSSSAIQMYIRFAKANIRPVFLPEAEEALENEYCKLRSADSIGGRHRQAFRVTVRQLESVIRLSEALARLHLNPNVQHFLRKISSQLFLGYQTICYRSSPFIAEIPHFR